MELSEERAFARPRLWSPNSTFSSEMVNVELCRILLELYEQIYKFEQIFHNVMDEVGRFASFHGEIWFGYPASFFQRRIMHTDTIVENNPKQYRRYSQHGNNR